MRRCRYLGAARSRSAASGRGFFGCRSRANLAYELAVPARYGDAWRARSWRPGRNSASPLRHRGAGGDAHRKGPRVAATRSTANHRARSRSRPHGVDQEGLYRPRDGAASGFARRAPARFCRVPAGRSQGAAARGRAFPRRGAAADENDEGYMTSALLAHARSLDRPRRDLQRGRRASASACAPTIRCATAMSRSKSDPLFFDPEGARLHG